jgi:hypothetical protein
MTQDGIWHFEFTPDLAWFRICLAIHGSISFNKLKLKLFIGIGSKSSAGRWVVGSNNITIEF